MELNPELNFIQFYVDNQAALTTIGAVECTQLTVHRARTALNKLGIRNVVQLEWVRAHVGTEGNETADVAA